MAESTSEYLNVQRAAREAFESDEPGRILNVGTSRITLSKVRKLEAGAEFPEPYPEIDLPAAEDYSAWLK